MAFNKLKPDTVDNYSTEFTQNVKANQEAIVTWLDSTYASITGTPVTYGKRYNRTSAFIEEYSGAVWGNLPLNIPGNAATATNASNLVGAGAIAATITATTKAAGTSDTTLATTAFVDRLRDIPGTAKTAAYTLTAADRGSSIDTTAGVTIPADATATIPLNATISVTNTSAAAIIITQDTGNLVRLAGTASTGNRTLAAYGTATFRKVAANLWFAVGAGLS